VLDAPALLAMLRVPALAPAGATWLGATALPGTPAEAPTTEPPTAAVLAVEGCVLWSGAGAVAAQPAIRKDSAEFRTPRRSMAHRNSER